MWEGWKDVVAVVSNSFRSPFKCTLPLPGSPFTPTDTLKEDIVWRRVSPWYITRRLNALSVRHHHPRWPPTIHLTRNRYYRYTHHDIHNNCDVILYVPLQFLTPSLILISPTPQNLLLSVHLDDGDQRRHFVPMVVEGLSLGTSTRRSMRRIMVLVPQLLLPFLLMLLGTGCLFMVSQHLSTERRREIAPFTHNKNTSGYMLSSLGLVAGYSHTNISSGEGRSRKDDYREFKGLQYQKPQVVD